jgi:hypothetical protein
MSYLLILELSFKGLLLNRRADRGIIDRIVLLDTFV